MPASSRPRRNAAAARDAATVQDADPEFLALSKKQQRAIDRAFARGSAGPSSRKRRRVAKPSGGDVSAGGFMPEEEEEDGAGGFLPDDEDGGFIAETDGDGDGGGGFVVDDEASGAGGFLEAGSEGEGSRRIPLHVLPAILNSLGLPTDADVIAVFRASASGWANDDDDDGGSRKRSGNDDDGPGIGVELKDWRAVCAALMAPDGDDDEGLSEEEEEEEVEVYEEEEASSLSSLSSDYDAEPASPSKGAGKGKGKGTGRGRKAKIAAELAETGSIKLSSRQKEVVRDIWNMLKPPPPPPAADSGAGTGPGSGPGPGAGAGRRGAGTILGRDEVKKWVRNLGEMWTEDEITEMVSLFSTQHEGRGLSFDDFGAVMVRAGLA